MLILIRSHLFKAYNTRFFNRKKGFLMLSRYEFYEPQRNKCNSSIKLTLQKRSFDMQSALRKRSSPRDASAPAIMCKHRTYMRVGSVRSFRPTNGCFYFI